MAPVLVSQAQAYVCSDVFLFLKSTRTKTDSPNPHAQACIEQSDGILPPPSMQVRRFCPPSRTEMAYLWGRVPPSSTPLQSPCTVALMRGPSKGEHPRSALSQLFTLKGKSKHRSPGPMTHRHSEAVVFKPGAVETLGFTELHQGLLRWDDGGGGKG